MCKVPFPEPLLLILPLPDILRPGREAVTLEGNPQEGLFPLGMTPLLPSVWRDVSEES